MISVTTGGSALARSECVSNEQAEIQAHGTIEACRLTRLKTVTLIGVGIGCLLAKRP